MFPLPIPAIIGLFPCGTLLNVHVHVHWLMSLVHQAQILNGDAGLLQGSRSSVVRASTAKVGGLGFDSQWLPRFFPSVCFYSDLPPVAYQQFLLPVVVIRIVTKIVMYGVRVCNSLS